VYFFNTLHPMPIVLKPGKASLPKEMLITFLSFFGASTVLCIGLIRLRYRFAVERDALRALESEGSDR